MDAIDASMAVAELSPAELVLLLEAASSKLVVENPGQTGAHDWLEWAQMARRVGEEAAKLRRLMGPKNLADMRRVVEAHAKTHYDDGGWDVVVECWTEAEIEALLVEVKATTDAEAVAAFEPLVDAWADRQADAKNSAF